MLIALTAAVCLAVPSDSRAAKFVLGAFAGANNGNLNGDSPPGGSYTTRSGVLAGAEFGIYLVDDVILSLQPMYLQQGSTVEYRNSLGQKLAPDVNLILDYIEIPLIVEFVKKSRIKPYAAGGFSLGFLTKADVQEEGQPAENIKGDLRSTNISIIFGAGVMFPVRKTFVSFEVRYLQGLTNIDFSPAIVEPEPFGTPSDERPLRLKTSSIEIIARIYFPLGN